MPRQRLKRTKILTHDEIRAVISSLQCRKNKNAAVNLMIFRLATCCGLRRCEIAGLSLRDVHDFGPAPQLAIPKAIAKGRKSREVPLNWDVENLAAIKEWKETPASCRTMSRSSLFVGMGRMTVSANVNASAGDGTRSLSASAQSDRQLSVHSGRHSFISHRLHAGIPLPDVRDAAGHYDISITDVYLHALDDHGVTSVFSSPHRVGSVEFDVLVEKKTMREEGKYAVYTDDDCENEYSLPDGIVKMIQELAEEVQPFIDDNVKGQIALRMVLGFLKKHTEALYGPDLIEEKSDILRKLMRSKGLGDHAEEQVEKFVQQQKTCGTACHQFVAAMCVMVDHLNWAGVKQMASEAAELHLRDSVIPSDWEAQLAEVLSGKSLKCVVEMIKEKGIAK